jgi:hypothetical protein
MSSLQLYEGDDASEGGVSHASSGYVYRGPPVDAEGRLLDPRKLWEVKQDNIPEEDLDLFTGSFVPQQMSAKV